MKSKYLYLLILLLIVTNIFTVFNDRKKGPRKNSDFYREIKFLKKELEFSENQIDLAKEEYKRYKNKKDSIENKFRKYDIVIMNDISIGNNNNPENMEKYYGIAKLLNEERMKHWRIIRSIANENQERKLDSIWSKAKEKITSTNWFKIKVMKIGVLSDTHNYLPKKAIQYLEECDEIWHGGDIGSINILEKLEQICLTRAVWGNIDNEIIKRETEEYLIFKIKNFKILIIHIAGKINSYNKKTRDLILENKPNLLVCGHSHILKIVRDKKYNLIYLNPGAAGKVGFHKEKTMIRFNLFDDKIEDMQVIKLDG